MSRSRSLRRLCLVLTTLASFPAERSGAGTVLPIGATWRYEATGADLGVTWRQPDYDDVAWPDGPAPLGYGEGYIATPVPYGPDSLNKFTTTYFRTTFLMTAPPASVEALLIAVSYDDGFVAYLNGNVVVQRSMPPDTISYGTAAAAHEGGGYEQIDLAPYIHFLVQGTNVMAVEIHQASPASSDMVLDMSVWARTSPPVVTRGPFLQSGSHDRMTLCWRTDHFTDSQVHIGAKPVAWTEEVTIPTLALDHAVTLTGLAAGTRYHYDVGTSEGPLAGGDADHYFQTSPAPGAEVPLRIWAIGDGGTGTPSAAAVRDAYAAYNASGVTDAWLLLGDNAYALGTDGEYQTGHFNMYPGFLRNTVLWPARGNHDQPQPPPDLDYLGIFALPSAGQAGGVPSGTESYYAFDFGNVHFICLDSFLSNRTPTGPMLTWLAADLAAAAGDWTIAYWHHPPYTRGSHNSDNPFDSEGSMRDMRENVLPVLEAAGVDLVLSGHSHSYERSRLLDGHYGTSDTYVSSFVLDSGDGRWDGDGPYHKLAGGPSPHSGTIYVVAGSSGQASGGTFDHPALPFAINELGSLVIDVNGPRLDVRFLQANGVVGDSFTVVKSTGTDVASGPEAHAPRLGTARPNPFSDETRFAVTLARGGHLRLEVFDLGGRRVRVLADGPGDPGTRLIRWDGRDDSGAPLSAGVYWVALRAEGRATATKVVIAR